jgi:hypothetical protein
VTGFRVAVFKSQALLLAFVHLKIVGLTSTVYAWKAVIEFMSVTSFWFSDLKPLAISDPSIPTVSPQSATQSNRFCAITIVQIDTGYKNRITVWE